MGKTVMRLFLALMWLLLGVNSYALTDEQVLVVSKCLLSQGFQYQELAELKNIRLIKTTQLRKLQYAATRKPRRCKGFMNVTQDWQRYTKAHPGHEVAFLNQYLPEYALSDLTRGYRVQYHAQIQALFDELNSEQVKVNLQFLSDFSDRYADSETGVKASEWIESQLKKMLVIYGRHDAEVYKIATKGVKQSSVVLKIGNTLMTPAVVVGSHMDTLAATFNNRKPGADDGASGVVTTLEAARVLLNSGIKFKKPIYFIWYAAEEEGKLGSQRVVKYFNQHHVAVDAVLQVSMTGYRNKNRAGIGLVDDFTDSALTAFLADLISAYVKQPAGVVRCGYACSDHATWFLNGNRVVYPFETMDDEGNPYVDTREDTMNKLSMEHIMDFVKLSIAFAVELAEPE